MFYGTFMRGSAPSFSECGGEGEVLNASSNLWVKTRPRASFETTLPAGEHAIQAILIARRRFELVPTECLQD